MTTIPEIGSVWVAKDDPKHGATIVWSDSKYVVYDCSTPEGYAGRSHSTPESFLYYYKPKPTTININGVELPEPMREVPNEGEMYWTIEMACKEPVCKDGWNDCPFELRLLKRGQLFRTKEDAQAWFEFEVKQRGGEV